ncbi:Short-chain dehydrogenase [Bryocella elongata]|uniref:Short-chain dehydrogenase n=1 Tax=Bryocella elongata TaxID=863522 RepID=A0A1H6BZU3_9BACT|nr:SDR family oxidoreductase [Bryocella elongata]SEG65955.1 Short-chain dehydrogenase [Bryocella elongata]
MKNAITLLKSVAMAGAAITGAGVAGAVVGGTVIAGLAFKALRSRPLADGSVVLVTGGSRGLGLAIASRFARNKIRLALASRNRAELEKAQAQLLAEHTHLRAEDFYLIPADLSERSECERMVAETISHFGRIDILVNNAGIIEVGPIESQTLEAFERSMKVNFLAALYATWAALPYMRTQRAINVSGAGSRTRARIVNIASIGGKMAVPHMLPYSAAKFALVGFSEGLHAEIREKGIRVTTVCPGLMRTGGEAHAQFVGDVKGEKKWFNLAATLPVVSVTAKHAANCIYRATMSGRAEITISPQAWLMARTAGVFPETTQLANALTNRFVLPKAPAVALKD